MTATTTVSPTLREPQLIGQTVVVIGSSGIGLETARRACAEEADLAALAVQLMTNTALTGATYDIDGGQQMVEA
jgi:NAD(P)-dependent dehydrogenase (short-subunit alcohol dehydrogenase family)